MSVNQNIQNVAYGLQNGLQSLNPLPIRALRAPTSDDRAELGTFWYYINTPVEIYILASGGNWVQLPLADGPGIFSSLAVNGPTVLDGQVLINTEDEVFTLVSGTGTISIGADAVAKSIVIGNATGATSVAISSGTGDVTVDSADAVLVDAAGALELNSSAGVISIGNDAVAQNINIGTGAAARVITVGNVTGATGVAINSGTAGVAVVSTGAGDISLTSGDAVIVDAVGVVDINSSAAAINIGNDADAFGINIGTGAAARTVTVGNATGATAVAVNSGTGGITLSAAGGAVSIVSNDTSDSASFTATNNALVGRAILTGNTLAQSATQVVTLSNTNISTSVGVIYSISSVNATGDAVLTVEGAIQSANALAITVTNDGGATGLTADDSIIISFIVLG